MLPSRRHLRIGGVLALTAGLCGAVASSGFAATTPTAFAPFRGNGPGFSYTFAKPARSTRQGVVQFQFPGTLHVASVHALLYALVSVFLLFVGDHSQPPSAAEQTGDISRDCLGRVFVTHPVPASSTGFSYECRLNHSEWMCTSDVERRNGPARDLRHDAEEGSVRAVRDVAAAGVLPLVTGLEQGRPRNPTTTRTVLAR